MKGYFKESSGLKQSAVLIAVCICSICLSMFVCQVYLLFSPYNLKVMLGLQNSLPLLMTALGTQYLISDASLKKAFELNSPGWKLSLIGIFTLLVSGPLIETLNEWNQHLVLPSSLKSIEEWMINSEKQMAELSSQLLSTHSISGFIFNILQIAILAGICEELLFRGVIQKIMVRWTGNIHVGIWIAAFIFSAIHLQFFGFLPRLLLGAILGYLFALSGTLWVPIIAHVANNAGVILVSKFSKIEPLGSSNYPEWFSVISLMLVCYGLYSMRRYAAKRSKALAPQGNR